MRHVSNQKGFSLMELMVIIFIVSTAMTAMMQLYIYTMFQTELAEEKTSVLNEVQNKVEEIRMHSFSSIATDYAAGGANGNTFALTSINGEGMIDVLSENSDLLTIEVSASWHSKTGRVVGEDVDLDGVWEPAAGEDVNGNGLYDPAIKMRTMLTAK